MQFSATLLSLFFLFPLIVLCDRNLSPKKHAKDSAKLPPCAGCAALVNSFNRGLERTSRGKLEGGDAAWEEKKQKEGYSNSEVRFVEIQESLCRDIERGEIQCHDNHHHWEEHLESWWALGENRQDLKQYLCVDKLKVCCPEDTYGPDCKSCQVIDSTSGKVCSGNGKCKGAGTRKGNGKCACDTGYAGHSCSICDVGYYQSYKNEDTSSDLLLCSACHKGCKGHCTGPGPKACAACRSGYTMDTEHGCTDIDECAISTPCTGNKFCVNTEGTFRCMNCDKSCKGCQSDGPDSCIECAEGYQKNDGGVCISDETAGRIFTISNSRFLTYIGLIVAACIIFQRSPIVSGILGVIITFYVSLSEYYLSGATGELRPIS
nr:cysteine-rich with EGF-like domain protein 2 isoform X1 [Lepeophtheirus salmonis]XP_040579645.1 cysteine-rich with EGF-like domain protein 2 isoform X1 [Lepeophtheirus salmonis]XP_040579650.1 cysteine-rich with EGF-like domain protein 2 isoform X1 [Lepeophtheirus salmonis]